MGFLRPLSAVVAAAPVFFSAGARAEGTVVRVGGTCVPPGTSLDATLSILKAELSPMKVLPLDGTSPSPDATNVVIAIDSCTLDPPGARITVWTNNAPSTRSVVLSDAQPDARDRTLALALAEATRDFAFPERRSPAPVLPEPAPLPAKNAPEPRRVVDDRTVARDPVPEEDARRARAVPRAAALFRFVASPSTVLGGAEVGVAWPRVTLSIGGLATGRSVSIGSATLFALYATPRVNVIDVGDLATVHVDGELGLVTGAGSAIEPATGGSASALHAALGAGLSKALHLGAGWVLDGALTAGYASSLTLRASNRELIGLAGFYAGAALGVRLPWAP